MKFGSAFIFLLILSFSAWSQEKEVPEDTLHIEGGPVIIGGKQIENIVTTTPKNAPGKASLYSALLPGLGQAYNKKYWKIPLIYTGAVFLISSINNFNDEHSFYFDALIAVVDGNPDTENPTTFNESQIRRRVEFFRRNRDFFVILTGVWYALNIIDAHVDAHLKEFDISDELSLNLRPGMIPNDFNVPNFGLTVQLRINP
ncbi:DUF5683 domain-containing protein [Fulvivirgaceae bacterium BMA10]|uniref:DUF5683 domain-containing protein n=1 Tax=Splendidivirga corallicola TaxID=3051826 RepID=A0ABT8KR87_9BACT|nr:DUF5683 domain-containing protein [Fulvivirgaceae bacterium BMA10]